jgi:GT2 family glycosyltransferase
VEVLPLKPKVAIIILTYNSKSTLGDFLDKAVQSAIEQEYPNLEIIVADNGSHDGTYEYVVDKYSSHVKIIRLNKNYGFCLGNNLALKHISQDVEYILFQNPDTILKRDYVKKLVEVMERNPRVGAIQGLEIKPTGERLIGFLMNAAGYYHEILLYDKYKKNVASNHCIEVFFVAGAAMLVRRRVFEIVGGFPSENFLYFDEADLGFRLRALGSKILGCTHTSYIHLVSGTVSKIPGFKPAIYYFHTRNRMLTVLKYFYGYYLIKALLLNAKTLLAHLILAPSVKRRTAIHVIKSVFKRITSVMEVRKAYINLIKKRRILERFLVQI